MPSKFNLSLREFIKQGLVPYLIPLLPEKYATHKNRMNVTPALGL